MTSLTGCLDKYIICQLPEFVNFPLISFSSAVASPIQFTWILSQNSLYHFQAVYCLCNKRLFSFISLYPINIPLSRFCPFLPRFYAFTQIISHLSRCTLQILHCFQLLLAGLVNIPVAMPCCHTSS